MNLPNNWGDRVPTCQILLPNKASNTETELHLIELLPKEIPWEFPSNSRIC